MTRNKQSSKADDAPSKLAAIAAEIGADFLSADQIAILKNAGRRPDGALLPLPPGTTIDRAGLKKAVAIMQRHDLVEEVEAGPVGEVWRTDDAGCRLTLRLTPYGRITMGAAPPPEEVRDAPEKPTKARKRNPARNTGKTPPRRPQKPQKAEIILRLLQRANGASIAQLTRATGWQPHSVRAALTGLRKKGHAVERTTGKSGQTVYHSEPRS